MGFIRSIKWLKYEVFINGETRYRFLFSPKDFDSENLKKTAKYIRFLIDPRTRKKLSLRRLGSEYLYCDWVLWYDKGECEYAFLKYVEQL